MPLLPTENEIASLPLSGKIAGIREPRPQQFAPVVKCRMLVQPPIHFVGLKSKETWNCFGSNESVVTSLFLVSRCCAPPNNVRGAFPAKVKVSIF